MKLELNKCILMFSVVLGSSLVSNAATVAPTKANGDFIAGTGIPGDNFTVATGATGEQVALKARNRATGQPLLQSGSTYYVSPGLTGASPTLTFDYQFTPGSLPNYGLKLDVDFDPGAGTNFATIDQLVLGGWSTAPFNDGFFLNPGGGAWSDNAPLYVYSQSWNLGYTFWSTVFGKSYDPNAPGTYEIVLTAYDPNTSAVLSTSAITAVVVPLPPSAWAGLALLGGLGVTGFVRNRREQIASLA